MSVSPFMGGDGSAAWLADHLRGIESRIWDHAKKIAEADKREVEPKDIAQAALLFAPGERFPEPVREVAMSVLDVPGTNPFWSRMGMSISGITLVSALLAIIFGLIAYFGASSASAQFTSGAFDIAELFAGAVLGSTGANAFANNKRE